MFVYSARPLLGSFLGQGSESVNQVDLVPTLATILGSPVPFSSLGSLIVEALPATQDWRESFQAVVSNVNQVHTYIKTYARTVSQFTDDSIATLDREYKNLQRLSTTVKTLDDFKSYVLESRKYLTKVKTMCEEIWVKFDLPLMLTGLILITLMIIISLIVIQTIPSQKIFAILESRILCYIAIVVFMFSVLSWFLFGLFLECSCSLSIIASLSLIYNNYNDVRNGLRAQGKHSDWLNFIASLFILGNILGMFSNSYVVEESSVVSFWLVTLVVAVLFSWKRETGKPSKGQNTWLPFSVEKFVAIILAVAFCFAVRSLQYYWQCREEQTWCQNLPNLASTISKSGSVFKEVTFFPLVSITIPVVIVWMWLRKCGNLVELTMTITTIKIVPILITIFTSVYWVLEALPLKVLTKMVPWNIQLIPQLVYMLIVITLLCLVVQPLCVHVVLTRRNTFHQIEGERNIVPHIFHHIKNALSEDKSKDNKSVPAVYGLPTVFSATLLVVGLFLLQLLCLLQGSKFAPALVIMFFSSLLLLGILAVYRIHKAVLAPQLLYVPWYAVTAWGLLAVTTFYGTGHQTTFPGIHWQAAFVGTSGEFSSQLIPGLMVSASTFSTQAWLGVLLPLLLVCPFTLLATFPRVGAKQDVRRGAANGEVFLYENSTLAEHSAFLLCVKYILFYALRVCGAMAAALLHRRHLMVWKVFAPKLIFESAGLAVSMAAVLLGFLLLSLLTRRLHALMDRLQERQDN